MQKLFVHSDNGESHGKKGGVGEIELIYLYETRVIAPAFEKKKKTKIHVETFS
jgi:hypothetical protein